MKLKYMSTNFDHTSNQTLHTCITVDVSININELSLMSSCVTAIFNFTIARGKMITSALTLYARLIILYSPSKIRVKFPLIFGHFNAGLTLTLESLQAQTYIHSFSIVSGHLLNDFVANNLNQYFAHVVEYIIMYQLMILNFNILFISIVYHHTIFCNCVSLFVIAASLIFVLLLQRSLWYISDIYFAHCLTF